MTTETTRPLTSEEPERSLTSLHKKIFASIYELSRFPSCVGSVVVIIEFEVQEISFRETLGPKC